MGKLEERARKRKRKQDIQQAVLFSIAAAGFLATAVLAPNALQLLRYLPGERNRYGQRIKTAAGRIVAKGQAEWVERDGKRFLRLTSKGKRTFAFEQTKVALTTRKKKKWDGRWRMVVFDIPERRRRVRSRLRGVMQEVGFVRMQDSVWVYPYDCEDFIALLKMELKIGKDVLYAIADTIEYDKPLRMHFALPLT